MPICPNQYAKNYASAIGKGLVKYLKGLQDHLEIHEKGNRVNHNAVPQTSL